MAESIRNVSLPVEVSKTRTLFPSANAASRPLGDKMRICAAGPPGQVAAAGFIFVLRIRGPTPQLTVLIQRHQWTIRW